MNKDRNMPYGYAGPIQGNTMNPQMGNPQMMGPQMMSPQGMSPIYETQYNDSSLQNRVTKLERQMKRIEQRIMKLESISGSSNFNDPDNSMYMI